MTQTLVPSPRVERSKAAILAAAADLLIEGGASKVTVDRVSERSGVAKTTIYRHWSSRSQVLFDAFASLLEGSAMHAPEGIDLRDQLITLIRGLTRGVTSSKWGPVMASVVEAAERDAELRDLIQQFLFARLEGCRALLVEAQRAGTLRRDVEIDIAMSMLAGPVFYRRLISNEEMGGEFADRLVDQFLAGAAT